MAVLGSKSKLKHNVRYVKRNTRYLCEQLSIEGLDAF